MGSTFDLEKEHQTADSSVQSSITKTPSAADLESENHNAPNGQETSYLPEKVDSEELDADDESQYPHGIKLLIIVAALGMSIFLVALDMVCLTIPQRGEEPLFKMPSSSNVNVKQIDDCGDGYSKNHRSVPQSQ